jgi:hypothetical protein
MEKRQEQILTRYKAHKYSVRFNADGGANNVIDSLYLKRPFSDSAVEIRVTIEILESR